MNKNFLLILTGLALLLAFSAQSLSQSQKHLFPIFDEADYLDMARAVSETGIGQTVADYLSAKNIQGIRNPFYLLTLAPMMDQTPSDFSRAKLFSLAQCWLLIILVFLLSRSCWGSTVACGTMTFLCFSPVLVQLSHQVLADIIFSLLFFVSLTLISIEKISWKNWALSGFLMGLAYLTKANGHFLLLAPLAVAAYRFRKKMLLQKPLWSALSFFILASFFLVARNIQVWKTPFYNINHKVFWMDSWDQYWFFQNSPDLNLLGLSWYWTHHTVLEMIQRVIYGFRLTLESVVECFSFGSSNTAAMSLTGTCLLGLAFVGLYQRWKENHRQEIIALLAVALPLLAAFIWGAMPMGKNIRYLFPLVLCALPFSVLGMKYLFTKVSSEKKEALRKIYRHGLLAIAVAVIMFHKAALTKNPLSLWTIPPFWKQTSDWITTHIPNESYLLSYASYFTRWHCCRNTGVYYPLHIPDALIGDHIVKKQLRYVLIDQTVAERDPYQEKYLPKDEFGPVGFLGWNRCFHDSLQPSILLIYGQTCPS